jgi:hypothetical protein
MAAADNKTLRTKCAGCDKELSTDVSSDAEQRTTWPLLGDDAGVKKIFPACTACYQKGWRPPGYVASALFGNA